MSAICGKMARMKAFPGRRCAGPKRMSARNIGRSAKRSSRSTYPELGKTSLRLARNGWRPGYRGGPDRARRCWESTTPRCSPRLRAQGARVLPHRERRFGHAAASASTASPSRLSGVRIVDLTWMLASAGAGRFFTALGAEVIKVEHLIAPGWHAHGHGQRAPRRPRRTRRGDGPAGGAGDQERQPQRLVHGDQCRQARTQPQPEASARARSS